MINDFFVFLEIKQNFLLIHFHCSFLLNDQTFCYVPLIQMSYQFALVEKHKMKLNIFKLLFSVIKQHTKKADDFVYSTQYQSSQIPTGGLEIPLKLTFKSPNFVTHQKIEDFMKNLYQARSQEFLRAGKVSAN